MFATSFTHHSAKKILYVHYMIGRIGHLAGELNYLRNCFPESAYQVEIVTLPLHRRPETNLAVFRIATRGLQVTYLDSKELFNRLVDFKNDPIVIQNDTLCNLDFYDIYDPYNRLTGRNKRQPYKFSLTEEEELAGQCLRSNLGIPPDAKVVTLHVREGGYLPNLNYHSFRDADINNYLSAIKFLIDQGYYVVRIGDKTMKPLGDVSAKFIDGPFSKEYCDFFDPYFIAQSEFYIGMLSGPLNIAQAFEVPTLVVNGQICAMACVYYKGIFCPKKIYSKNLKRFLSYPEIAQSPIVDTYRAEDFAERGLEFIENTSEEILLATKEMHAKLNDCYAKQELATSYDQKIREIHRQVSALRDLRRQQHTPSKKTDRILPYYLDVTDSQFSTEFLNLNQEFLGYSFF